MNPRELMRWNRFDLPFKYLYANSRKRGLKTEYFLNLYKHHLQVWNDFSEYNDLAKQNFSDFQERFDSLIDDIFANGFDMSKSMVAVQDRVNLLNGAHRVAACLAANREVTCFEGSDSVDGQADCSWQFFQQHKRFGSLDPKAADQACIELIKFRPKTRIVTLYPNAVNKGKLGLVREILNRNGGIVFEKKVYLNKLGGHNLMRELYYKEEWAEKNNGAGYKAKASFCYKRKNILGSMSPTYFFMAEFDGIDAATSVKEDIRSIYKLGKHSVHINDTHEESIRLAKCILNQNSINFLNRFNGIFFPKFEGLLNKFQSWIKENDLEPENYCISAGSVLTAYGLKECKDLDYLHTDDKQFPENSLIQSHNNYGVNWYHEHRDDIVHNPDNHFYRYGVKYSSPEVVIRLKQKRGEEKDIRDIKLLNSIIS